MGRYVFNLFLACTALACAPHTESVDVDPLDPTRVIEEGSPEAFALLAFLNDPGTTEPLLDDDVGLDSRAAESIIDWRNGPDGQLGIGQDRTFETVQQVDDLYYVGNSAFEKMLAWITANDWVPGPTDTVGSWDGVSFTMEEAEWTLDLANTASTGVLDVELALDSRAVDSIEAARPIDSMTELAGLYYVGQTALETLKDAAIAANQGAGEGEACATTDDCASGLLCLGEYRFYTGLFCVDESMAGTFENTTDVGAIPDPGLIASPVLVSGLASVPVDIIVTLDIEHPNPADLIVTLHDPNGDIAQVWNQADSPADEVVIRNGIPGDDAVNGTWTLQVEDVVSGVSGQLHGWSLYIVSNWD